VIPVEIITPVLSFQHHLDLAKNNNGTNNLFIWLFSRQVIAINTLEKASNCYIIADLNWPEHLKNY
jgi:hypothetical protein